MSEHLYRAEEHGSRIGHVLEGQVQPHVPRPLLKHDVLPPHVPPGANPGSAHQPRPNVPDDVAVEIGHHHDVELLGSGHQLDSVCVCTQETIKDEPLQFCVHHTH